MHGTPQQMQLLRFNAPADHSRAPNPKALDVLQRHTNSNYHAHGGVGPIHPMYSAAYGGEYFVKTTK